MLPMHTRRLLAQLILLLGLAAVASVPVAWYFSGSRPQEPSALPASRGSAVHAALPAAIESPAVATAAVRPPHAARCSFDPIIPPATASDGRRRPEHPFPGGPRIKAKVFERAAERAASAGRLRDAEVALIAACQQFELASAAPAVPLARVMGRLGDHYAAAGTRTPDPALREALLERMREVLQMSADSYAKALGPNASLSRIARERLLQPEVDDLAAAVEAQVPPARRTSEPRLAATPAARVQPTTARTASTPAPHARKEQGAAVLRRQDVAEIRQLDSDLARLRAQAEAVSDDPEGLRRRAEAARALRDRCQDAACLRAWYQRRRDELLVEF